LASGLLRDCNFPGIRVIINYLIGHHDKALIMRYADWVIRRDPMGGLKIFVQRTDTLFTDAEIQEFISQYGSKINQEYFRFLIFTKGSNNVGAHSTLAKLYFDEIVTHYDPLLSKEICTHS
jgi:hypothetical protein